MLHVFAGGPIAARPLLLSDMRDEAKYTNYYCWHLVSIVIAAMTFGFAYAAVEAAGRDVAIIMTVLAGMFAAWSLGLVLWKRQRPFRLPQWLLFAPIAVLGAVGSC